MCHLASTETTWNTHMACEDASVTVQLYQHLLYEAQCIQNCSEAHPDSTIHACSLSSWHSSIASASAEVTPHCLSATDAMAPYSKPTALSKAARGPRWNFNNRASACARLLSARFKSAGSLRTEVLASATAWLPCT